MNNEVRGVLVGRYTQTYTTYEYICFADWHYTSTVQTVVVSFRLWLSLLRTYCDGFHVRFRWRVLESSLRGNRETLWCRLWRGSSRGIRRSQMDTPALLQFEEDGPNVTEMILESRLTYMSTRITLHKLTFAVSVLRRVVSELIVATLAWHMIHEDAGPPTGARRLPEQIQKINLKTPYRNFWALKIFG